MRPLWNPKRSSEVQALGRKGSDFGKKAHRLPRLAAPRVPCYFAPVASPPDAGGSRYVGRVVDPDVREDGETEPEVELNPSPKQAAAVADADSAPGPEQSDPL